MNYLLIDYENVQPKSLGTLKGQSLKILVFIGANQKVRADFANALQSFGNDVEHIQISGSGPNALDFHIAFTMGEIARLDADATFRIISKDKGFDPLVKYLRGKGIVAHRWKALPGSSPDQKRGAQIDSNPLEIVLSRLPSCEAKPRNEKKLANWINAQLRSALDDSQMQSLIKALESERHISIDNGKITYPASAQSLTLVR